MQVNLICNTQNDTYIHTNKNLIINNLNGNIVAVSRRDGEQIVKVTNQTAHKHEDLGYIASSPDGSPNLREWEQRRKSRSGSKKKIQAESPDSNIRRQYQPSRRSPVQAPPAAVQRMKNRKEPAPAEITSGQNQQSLLSGQSTGRKIYIIHDGPSGLQSANPNTNMHSKE